MLEAALAAKSSVHFIRCTRNGGAHAFRDWVHNLASKHPQLERFCCCAEDEVMSPAAHKVVLLSQKQLATWFPE